MKSIIAIALTLMAGVSLASWQGAAAQTPGSSQSSCAPAGDLHFVCGLVNVEDFAAVDGGRWLVGGSYQTGSAGLYLIDTAAKSARPVALTLAAKPDPAYPGCSAPDLKGLMTHGIDVAAGPGGTTTVFVVNHGGRESVEVFRLNPLQDAAEWIGCVLLPPEASGNGVAVVPRGGFVVSKFLDNRDKEGFQHLMAGQITGTVYRWKPGKGLHEIPGTRLPGDNGVAVSHDGKWLYVNAYGTREIYRFPLSGRGEHTSAKVDFQPDNLRWTPDGQLFVTGQFQVLRPPGQHGWAVARLDPRTMAITPVLKEPALPQFDDATSTVQVGRTLWFGTFRGDRMAYRPAP